jgi:transmembrane sensor
MDERMTQLIDGYLAGTGTAADRREVEEWYDSFEANQPWLVADDEQTQQHLHRIYQSIQAAIHPAAPVKRIFPWKKIAIAASFILAIGLGVLLMLPKGGKQPPLIAKTDIESPTNTKATITLADGRTISLDSLTTLTQNGVTVIKDADGKIVYQTDAGSTADVVYNILSNPRGSKVVSLTLSDGSKVWLNSESSLKYPIAFTGTDRRVEITGEAYFEVAHNAAKPFKANANNKGEITVLGTQFNVNSYEDEADTKITLIEGSVKVSNNSQSVTIRPGDQARISSNSPIGVGAVDLSEITAWKDNRFVFNSADIQTIIRQLQRWYDVDIQLQADIPDHFTGIISRSVNASEVFAMLQKTGTMKVKIEGRTIVITK